jgi:hypothetical protein
MERIRPALLLGFLALSCLLFSQTAGPSSPAIVSFTLDFPQSTPAHYSITVDASGKASYTSGVAQTASHRDSDSETTSDADEPYHYSFTVSPATRESIFDLAARANYFSGDINYAKRNIANTGAKILTYKDAQRSTEAKYNYTANPTVQQLTALFQGLSTTLEYGRRLEEAYHYQKLALDEQLKGMEEQANQNILVEVEAVAPILTKIAADPSVMNVTRARAQRLLAKAGNTPNKP